MLRTGLAEWALTPFESQAHMVEAMRDPQYRTVPAYVAAVEAKVLLGSRTNIRVYDDTLRTEPAVTGIGGTTGADEPGTESAAQLSYAESQKEANRLHAERYGSLSVAPAPRVLSDEDKEVIAFNLRQWNESTLRIRDAQQQH